MQKYKSGSVQPQKRVTSKCDSCIFQYDLLHNCGKHSRIETFSAGYNIVLQCDGHVAVGQPPVQSSIDMCIVGEQR